MTGINQTQLEAASPSSLIVSSEMNNAEEGSLIERAETEDFTLSAETILRNEQFQLASTSGSIVASATEKENQLADSSFISREEEGVIFDFGINNFSSVYWFYLLFN